MRKILIILVLTVLVTSVFSGMAAVASNNVCNDSDEPDVRGTSSRKTMKYITKFNNNLESKELEFSAGGGTDKTLNVTLPKRATVLSATAELEGLSLLEQHDYDFNDTNNNSAWKGYMRDKLPPSEKPSEYQEINYNDNEYDYITIEDSKYCSLDSGSAPYTSTRHYNTYKFTVTASNPSKFVFKWVGENWVLSGTTRTYTNEVNAYIYGPTNTTWVRFDFQSSTTTTAPAKIKINKEISQASSYIDTSDSSVYFMVVVPAYTMNMKGVMSTDFVKLTAYAGNAIYPSGASLDVGDDGDNEWSISGEFKTKVTIGDGEGFKAELQEHIDAAGTDEGTLDIIFTIHSGSAGRIWVGGLNISIEALDHNDPPEEVPGKLYHFYMMEDDAVSGDNLIDLRECFTDLQEAAENLKYEIEDGGDGATLEAVLDTDGYHVDFIPALNFYGTLAFRVKATDSGADELPDTFDDLVCKSRYFNVTVKPINDMPVIEVDNDELSVDETDTLYFNASVQDVDDTDFKWELQSDLENVNEKLIKDGGDSTAVQVELPPQRENVGKTIVLTLSVQDSGGGQGDTYKAYGYKNISVEILNVNDLPEFIELTVLPDLYTDPMIEGAVVLLKNEYGAIEDEYYNVSIVATDPDLGVEPNEVLTFEVIADETIDGVLEIDPASGFLSYIPTNADVGKVRFSVKVTDWQGEYAEQKIELDVKNRNDPPNNARIILPEERKFTTDDKITFKGECDDDDLDIPNSMEGLTYMWFTNHSTQTLGMGDEIYDITLEEGWYTITLEVLDSKNEVATDSIEIQVVSSEVDTPDDNDDTDPDDTDDDDDDDKTGLPTGLTKDKEGSNTVNLAIIAIIIIVIIIVGIMYGVVLPRRKKVEQEKEDDSETLTKPFSPVMMMPQGAAGQFPVMYQMHYGVQPQQVGMQPVMMGYPQTMQGAAVNTMQTPPANAAAVPAQQLPVAKIASVQTPTQVVKAAEVVEAPSGDPQATNVTSSEAPSPGQPETPQAENIPKARPVE
ncbi:MAG: hypothetical protein JSV49_09040 [Thermoplasmata archaeon]|nr:MAG: hypothetical protein JSV49_09040 [Thermoplasmata archaeon]